MCLEMCHLESYYRQVGLAKDEKILISIPQPSQYILRFTLFSRRSNAFGAVKIEGQIGAIGDHAVAQRFAVVEIFLHLFVRVKRINIGFKSRSMKPLRKHRRHAVLRHENLITYKRFGFL